MTSPSGKQTIALVILPNISRSKDNQIMKFGQLIEYNNENINSGIQFYCKGNNKKHQNFLKNNKILNIIILKLYIWAYIPKSIVKVLIIYIKNCNGLWNVSPNI